MQIYIITLEWRSEEREKNRIESSHDIYEMKVEPFLVKFKFSRDCSEMLQVLSTIFGLSHPPHATGLT